MRVGVVIPAHAEAERIGATVRAVRTLPGLEEVVVVDDGSPDETAAQAASAGARVIRLPQRRGKAEAVAEGLTQVGGEVLLLLDADLGESARHAHLLLRPLEADEADVVVARLSARVGSGGFGFARRRAAAGIERLTGRRLAAPLSGQRAFRRAVLAAVLPLGHGWELEVRFTVRALLAGYRLVEVPVPFEHRPTGKDLRGFWHRGRQWWAVERALWQLGREGRACSGRSSSHSS